MSGLHLRQTDVLLFDRAGAPAPQGRAQGLRAGVVVLRVTVGYVSATGVTATKGYSAAP